MELLKVGRRLCGSFNPDDYIDGAGYAAVAGEIGAARLRSTGRSTAAVDAANEQTPSAPRPASFQEVCDAMRILLDSGDPRHSRQSVEAT
jgi:hypothetical protein